MNHAQSRPDYRSAQEKPSHRPGLASDHGHYAPKAIEKRRALAAIPDDRRFALTDPSGKPADIIYVPGGLNKRGTGFRFGRTITANPDGFYVVFTERRKNGSESWEQIKLAAKTKRRTAIRAVSQRRENFLAEFGDQHPAATA